MLKKQVKNNLVIYQTKSGAIEFRGDFIRETIWATQAQIAEVFGVTIPTINEHLANIFKTQELNRNSVIRKFRITANDGKIYNTQFYNLDVIISVGYRVNSNTATMFRIWATKTLREHIIKGYTLNKKIILKNYDQFLKNIANIQTLLPTHVTLNPKTILNLVKEYSSTWVKIDAYDRGTLVKTGITKKKIKLAGGELLQAIFELKNELIKKAEATDIFAFQREVGNVEGIVGNVMQSFSGNDVYQTLEEKAAHLLYFMVKNHPFIDGNKRSGAFAFIWFLRRNGVKGAHNINPAGLTAITLLIAESDPKYKDKMVALVVELLKVNKK
ncbi:MAG: virulence protein RhuM/Fic/DOC family protein [Patescibacteria group bacterium]